VLSTLCSTATAGDPIVVDKWRPPYANMENLPPGFFAKSVNDSCMTAWNASVDLFRQFGSDGFWGANGVSEFAGFAPDADLASTYGFHYGSALALTIVSYDLGSNQITESDVCVNPAYQWTSSALAAEFSPTQYYLPAVMMHELGHALGVQTTAESYTYDVPERHARAVSARRGASEFAARSRREDPARRVLGHRDGADDEGRGGVRASRRRGQARELRTLGVRRAAGRRGRREGASRSRTSATST
jgi:hypothetical protein